MISNLDLKLSGKQINLKKILVYLFKFFNKQICLLKQCGLNYVITCNYNSSDRQNYQTTMFDSFDSDE